ncbi:mobile genetic element [Streptococcus pneumoniae]|nr:mobile genetic element [Streptococcus pneumoniae]
MNDEASKQLTDARFKRLVGVQPTTVDKEPVKNSLSTQRKRAKGGRKTKLSLDDLLMVTIQYMRE